MKVESELPFESIEEAVIEARSRISSFLFPRSGVEGDALLSVIRREWRSGISQGSVERIAAIDGSNNSEYLTLGQVIFAVSASFFMKDTEPVVARKYQIGVMDDYHYRERVSLCRETMELKMALRSLELGPEILLMDGSFLAMVDRGLWSTPYGQKVPYHMRRILREVESTLGLNLTEGLVSYTHLVNLMGKIEEIVASVLEEESGKPPQRDEIRRAMAFIERYEVLCSLNELLRRGRGVLVAVAKRSSSRLYFNSRLPDMEVVRRYTSLEPGYLSPKVVELSFPEYSGIDDTYPISLTYVRLERATSPLRVEVVGNVDESVLEELLGSLARYSVRGYPYHLRRVHELAKIGRDLMSHLSRNLLIPEVSGRERLGE